MGKKILTTAICALSFLSVLGQGTVSLDSCRSMAIRNNKALKMAAAGIESAAYEKKAAASAYLPGIDFGLTYVHNTHKINLLGADAKLPTASFNPLTESFDLNLVKNPLTGEPIVNPATGQPIPSEVAIIPKEAMSYNMHNVWAGAITLTQPIFMSGKIRAMNEITKYAEELARSVHSAAARDVVFAVDEAYWQVVSLRHKKLLAESYVKLVDSLRYNVDAMYREGVATRSDELKVEVKQNEARLALTKVDNGLSLSRMALAQICGLPVDTQMTLSDESVSDKGDHLPMPPAGYTLEDVYANRPDLQSIRHGISIFEAKEKLTFASMLPNLAFMGAFTFSNPNVNDGFKRSFGTGISFGATLTVPIWHWGGNYNRYKASRAQTNVQKLMLEDAKDKVSLQVSQAKFKCQEARKTYDMTVNNLKSANENLRSAQLGFREGVLTTEDVIMAQTAWLQANSDKIDAEIGIRLCDVYLSKVIGTLNY